LAISRTTRYAVGQSWPPQPEGGVSLVKGVSKEGEQQPPSWDPLGAAPFAWDLPEPGPATPPAPPRRRLPVTLVTLGVALLAAAGTGVVLLVGMGTAGASAWSSDRSCGRGAGSSRSRCWCRC